MSIIIGVDVDGVINDFCKLFIERFNKRTNRNLKREEIIKWNLKELINDIYNGEEDGNIANDIVFKKDFINSLELKEGVIEAFDLISKYKDIEIVIVTAILEEFIEDRALWLKEYLGKYNLKVYYESKKDKIDMNYLIDDAVHNLDMLSQKIGKDNCLCISEPYNADCTYNRFNSLKDAFEFILKKENL